MKSIFASVVCAVLAACGGGHSSPFVSTAEASQPVVIYHDGDSTTVGYTVTGGTISCNDGATSTGCGGEYYGHNVTGGTAVISTYNEPAVVQAQMDLAFGVGAATTENHGVGGMTVLDSINGTGGYDCADNGDNVTHTCGPLGARLAASHTRVVIGHFLTNDQYRMTAAQYGAYISTWISTVQGLRNMDGLSMTAVWEESAPICRNDAPDVGPYLTAARNAAAAAGVLVVLQHDWIYQNLDWKPMLADCVHPDNGLYSTMGDRLSTALGPTISALLGR